MAELRKLCQTRASIKGQMTRMRNALDAEITATEAEIRQRKIEQLWSKHEELQQEIDELRLGSLEDGDSPENIQRDSDAEREVFEDIYFAAATKAQAYIDAAAQQREAQQGNRNQNQGNQEDQKSDVRLPTLKLPEFKGDYEEWLLFKDAYVSMIHNNTNLKPIQKFQYLRSVLKGEALQVIGGLQTSAENYVNAWELLTKNYENTKLLINTHLTQLLDFPAVAKDKPATIKKIIVHIRTHLKALKTLDLPVESWDELLIHLTKSKFDYNTQKDWEEETNRNKTRRPTLEEYLTFLGERCRTLELLEKGKGKQDASKASTSKGQGKSVSLATVSQSGCGICTENHSVYRCPQFLQMPVSERMTEVNSKKLCRNCLGKGHFATSCKASFCKKCQKKHNTLLHLEQEEKPSADSESAKESAKGSVVAHCSKTENSKESEKSASTVSFVRKSTTQVILSTAQVSVEDADGRWQTCRLLLDPGSQSHLVTEELVRKLKLKCKKQSELISGVNKSQTNTVRTAVVKIKSRHADYEATLDCLVLPTITEKLPQVKINRNIICLPEGLVLADPNFHEPSTIDILVGAALFWQLLCPNTIKRAPGMPILHNTLLGWIVGGELVWPRAPTKFCGLVTNAALQAQLEQFWNQEETETTRHLTIEEAECERQFVETVTRDSTGRFIVALPKKREVQLGDSKTQAEKRLYSLERRFRRDPEMKKQYIRFLKEYEDKQHMSLVPEGESKEPGSTYLLPHQPVIRLGSETTKLRVVFDASAKSSLGTALNDKLMVGPNLQNDLFSIVLRFRSHEFVLTADIEAMFRQILVRKEDRDLQRILWRTDSNQPIRTYSLNTVTYGTAPAPYLAIRCLRQLAAEETKLLRAAKVLSDDFYMDDVLTGAATIDEVKSLQQQLDQLLQQGQFKLRKWRSNDEEALSGLSESKETDSLLIIDKQGALKTLGLLWDAKSDTLQYNVKVEECGRITKRSVLSRIAQIFDPLGLLGPVVIKAKCVMQQMWQLKAGWDDSLPPELQDTWIRYYQSLPEINGVRIQRNVNQENNSEQFDLVGFGDASEVAYGACLYAVSQKTSGEVQSQLICAKSRVAPLKTVSLPRLELNAALLLAKLCDTARRAYGEKVRHTYLWSDSTIVLSWIATSPNLRKTYVANRVSKIQILSKTATWRHVSSKDNPADLISRGMTVEDWIHSELWWHGPEWLTTAEWPQCEEIQVDNSEMKAPVVLTTTKTMDDILRRYSSFEKLKRTIAYCLRFKANALGEKKKGFLSCSELQWAEKTIAKMTQREAFLTEYRALERAQPIPKGSRLVALMPYLDEEGLLRVGGRLARAAIPEDQKHPIILPAKHHITKLIMKAEHIKLHHGGTEQLLYSVRQKYWPLSGRREAKRVTGSCLECFRSKPKTLDVLMGDLPKGRVCSASRPFVNTGIDYAGPLQVRESRRRGRVHASKAWIAVFVCFATKAVHLELVTELTTESFLAALRRFVARRGLCSQIVSDNGTNFVGAARELKEIYEFLEREQQSIVRHLSSRNVEWSFIPPRAPHFGGLWEAAVKATKRHLNVVTKGLVFTFEEYYTLLVEIESILNSRPLTPMSSDPKDLSALTPSHFLLGDTLSLPVEHSYLDLADNRLTRWQHLQKVRQHFWARWHREYLHELQKRQKWRIKGENLAVGTLVLLKEDHVPPLQWHLGRVAEVHPGADQVVRVATVRTSTGLFKRAVKNLCPLPTEED